MRRRRDSVTCTHTHRYERGRACAQAATTRRSWGAPGPFLRPHPPALRLPGWRRPTAAPPPPPYQREAGEAATWLECSSSTPLAILVAAAVAAAASLLFWPRRRKSSSSSAAPPACRARTRSGGRARAGVVVVLLLTGRFWGWALTIPAPGAFRRPTKPPSPPGEARSKQRRGETTMPEGVTRRGWGWAASGRPAAGCAWRGREGGAQQPQGRSPGGGSSSSMGTCPGRARWRRWRQQLQGVPRPAASATATTTTSSASAPRFWSMCWLVLGAWRGLLASACPTSCTCSAQRIWCSEPAASLVSFPVLSKRSELEKVTDMWVSGGGGGGGAWAGLGWAVGSSSSSPQRARRCTFPRSS